MHSKALVSVALLCYNHEKYIAKAIESVLEQTYINIELVIVDNASKDDSLKIIKNKSLNDHRVKLIELKENTFVSCGSNLAIKSCKGEYIASLSGDDYFEKDKIEKQMQFMQKNSITNSFTWVNCVNDNEKIIRNHSLEHIFNRRLSSIELKKILITEGNTLCATSFIFHKSIFEKYGYFDNRLLQSQDYDLWLKIIKYEDIHVLSERLTNYRVRDDGHNLSINMDEESRKRSIFECVNFLKQITDFDLKTLSFAIGKDCTKENRFYNLFEYFLDKQNHIYASAVLLSMFDSLNNDCSIPSENYNNFLKLYSSFDFLGIIDKENLSEIINKKNLQILELNEQIKFYQNMSINKLIKLLLQKIFLK